MAAEQLPSAVRRARRRAAAPRLRRWRARVRAREMLAVAFVALAPLALAIVTYRLWRLAASTCRSRSQGDNAIALSSIKTMDETGWYQRNPRARLAARPGALRLHRQPGGQPALGASVAASVGSANSAALVENLFILLSFPLASVSALRRAALARDLARGGDRARRSCSRSSRTTSSARRTGIYCWRSTRRCPPGLPGAGGHARRPLFPRRDGGRRALRWASWPHARDARAVRRGRELRRSTTARSRCSGRRGGARGAALRAGMRCGRWLVSGRVFAPSRRRSIHAADARLPARARQQRGRRARASRRRARSTRFKLAQFVLPSPTHRVDRLARLGADYDAETPVQGRGLELARHAPADRAGARARRAARAGAARPRAHGLLGDPRLAAAGVLAVAFVALGTLGGGGVADRVGR